MRLLSWWQVLLWVLGRPVRGVEGECGPGAVHEMTGRAEVHPGDALDLREGRRCAAHPFLASSRARLPDFSPRSPPARGRWKGAGGRGPVGGSLDVVGPRSGRLQLAAGSQKEQSGKCC